MTDPIAFTLTPHDAGTDNADAQDAFTQVATVTDANFEKINAYWRGMVPVIGRSVQVKSPDPQTPNVWVDFKSDEFPYVRLTLPPTISVVQIIFGINLQILGTNTPNPRWYTAEATFRISGNTTYPTAEVPPIWCQDSGVGVSRSLTIPGTMFTPGGVITVAPCWKIQADVSSGPPYGGDWYSNNNGSLFVIVYP